MTLMTGRIGAKDMTLFSKMLKVIRIDTSIKSPIVKEKFDNPIQNETYKTLTEAEIAIVMRDRRIKEWIAERDERLENMRLYRLYRASDSTSFDDWVEDHPGIQGTYEGWADANPEIYTPHGDN